MGKLFGSTSFYAIAVLLMVTAGCSMKKGYEISMNPRGHKLAGRILSASRIDAARRSERKADTPEIPNKSGTSKGARKDGDASSRSSGNDRAKEKPASAKKREALTPEEHARRLEKEERKRLKQEKARVESAKAEADALVKAKEEREIAIKRSAAALAALEALQAAEQEREEVERKAEEQKRALAKQEEDARLKAARDAQRQRALEQKRLVKQQKAVQKANAQRSAEKKQQPFGSRPLAEHSENQIATSKSHFASSQAVASQQQDDAMSDDLDGETFDFLDTWDPMYVRGEPVTGSER